MNIQDATKKAMAEDKYITIPSDNGKIYFKLKPTNTKKNIIAFNEHNAPVKSRKPTLFHGWQPNADDLISDDWQVVD